MVKMTFQISEERIVNKLYETTGCILGKHKFPSHKRQKQIPGGLMF